MKNTERDKAIDAINMQIKFCSSLLMRLDLEFNDCMNEQDKDPYDSWRAIRNHTRFAEDARRIRREALKLAKLLEEAR